MPPAVMDASKRRLRRTVLGRWQLPAVSIPEMPKHQKKAKKVPHDPLGDQITADETTVVVPREKKQKKKFALKANRTEADFIPEKLSRTILEEARKQQEEIDGLNVAGGSGRRVRFDDDEDDAAASDLEFSEGEEVHLAGEYVDVDATEEDEEMFKRFMLNDGSERRNLADMIMEKIREKVRTVAALSAASA